MTRSALHRITNAACSVFLFTSLLTFSASARASVVNGENASQVLGQTTFTAATAAITQSGMNSPQGVALDPVNHRLFVSDASNNRVVVFNLNTDNSISSNGMNASNVLGQANFTSGGIGLSQSGINTPYGLAYDSANNLLFVPDNGNNRVLVFNYGSNITSGLLGWWKFDESSGTSASDFTGNGNTGTLTSTNASFVAGEFGNAVSLTHTGTTSGGLVDVSPTNFSFEYNQPFTFAAWIYRSVITEEDDIFGKEDASNSYRGYGLWFTDATLGNNVNGCANGTSCLVAEVQNSLSGNNYGAIVVSASNVVSTGAWHHVAMTYDGSHTAAGIKVYVDGNAVTLTTYRDSLGTNTILNSKNLQIGANGDGDGSYDNGCCTFGGKIDDARVYNRALSASEITSLYNFNRPNGANASNVLGQPNFTTATAATTQAGMNSPKCAIIDSINHRLFVSDYGNNRVLVYSLTTSDLPYPADVTSGLVGWWKLNDGSGTTAADSSGNGLNGTLKNSPTWTTGGPANNGGLTFASASSKYVKVTDNAKLELSGSWTLAAWVYPTANPSAAGDMIDRDSTCDGCNSNYKLVIDNNDHCGALAWRVGFDTSSGTATGACYVTSIPLNTWYHVAGVWDSSTNNLYLYLNGSLVATQNTGSAVPATGTGGDLGLAAEIGQPRYFDGTLDDVRVYNVALSATDISNIYSAATGNGMNASYVLGQSSFTTSGHGTTQSKMFGPECGTFDPVNNRLFMADVANNRLLVFNTSTITNGMNATNVLGQANFTSAGSATTQSGMGGPHGAGYDYFINRLFVADHDNNRVLVFNNVSPSNIRNGMNASYVLGQAGFTSSGTGTTQSTLSGPFGSCYSPETHFIYVPDATNNRVMIFEGSYAGGGGGPSEWTPGYD